MRILAAIWLWNLFLSHSYVTTLIGPTAFARDINKHGGDNGRQRHWNIVKFLAKEKELWRTNVHSIVGSYIAFIRPTLVLGLEYPFNDSSLLSIFCRPSCLPDRRARFTRIMSPLSKVKLNETTCSWGVHFLSGVCQTAVYYISTEIYSLKWHCVIIVRNFATANQRRERWNFTSEKWSYWKIRSFSTTNFLARNLFQFQNQNGCMIYGRHQSVDNFISEQENKASTSQKTEREVKLLLYYTCFWKPRMKKEKWKIFRQQNWTSTCPAEFINSVITKGTKDGKEYTSHLLSEVY
jgi:hypothetical protein